MCITAKDLSCFVKNPVDEQPGPHEATANLSGQIRDAQSGQPLESIAAPDGNSHTTPGHNDDGGEEQRESSAASSSVSTGLCWRLYLSHFLSTWNSRSFEFAAVLFLAVIFPNTLLELSVYALVRSAAAIVFSTPIGKAIDKRDRLSVVRFSIVFGRLAVVISCVLFYLLYQYPSWSSQARIGTLAVLIILSCLEKVASVLNLVAVERDWVVVIAAERQDALQKLNARMRRIDLICKLVGPLVIALIDGASTAAAVLLLLGLNAVSVLVEYIAIYQVYRMTPALASRATTSTSAEQTNAPNHDRQRWNPKEWLKSIWLTFKFYFSHRACLPSFSLSLLYLTVLSFGGQMVTYLISAGFNSFHIALTRSLSVVFELSATWIAPRVITRVGPIRSGLWFINWQMILLGITVAFFWTQNAEIVAASGLAAGTILSRVGLWGYDLSAQVIIQSEVIESNRGSFSSTEASFQNAFELISYVLTIIWSDPGSFRYPVIISAVAVYIAGCFYAFFLRHRRGHLLHVPCAKGTVSEM